MLANFPLSYEVVFGDVTRPICGRGDACLKTLKQARLEASKPQIEALGRALSKISIKIALGLIYLFYLSYLAYWLLMNRLVEWLPKIGDIIKRFWELRKLDYR